MSRKFCDIADLGLIKKFNKKNCKRFQKSSLMRKAGAKDYKSYSKKILEYVKKNLSLLKFLEIMMSQ